MSYNMRTRSKYDLLINPNVSKFKKKKILLIGAGAMGQQYAFVLHKMKIRNVIVISNTKEKTLGLCKKYHFTPLYGGYEKHMPKLEKMDLVIVAPTIDETIPAVTCALNHGQDNLLIEKPVSLYHDEIIKLSKMIKKQRIRIAYNRLVYPNYYKLKQLVTDDGGITSCRFTVSERIHKIPFKNFESLGVLRRYGVYVTIHVISIVADLIGIPKKITSMHKGHLRWHPSGSIFIGNGISTKNIPFSYYGDWNSSGRWSVEITTKKNTYRLMPLEDLHIYDKNSEDWIKVNFTQFLNVKQGIAEEIMLMLDKKLEKSIPLTKLTQATEFVKFAEKIFGYNKL